MTIEIADRLIKLRKKYGYSQEELADKLGLSRQAVSKWERAEASPDTDNLICLAKLYGVSLDELLSTDEDVDTIVKEQVKKDESAGVHISDKDGSRIDINDKGVRLTDDDGSTLVVDNDGIHGYDKDGKEVKRHHLDKTLKIIGIIEGGLGIVSLVAFFLLGSLLGAWYWAWTLFFVPEIICSFARAIHKRNASEVNMPFIVLFTFFFVCMAFPGLEANLWHPMWVIFFAIPLYYISVNLIKNIIHFKEK